MTDRHVEVVIAHCFPSPPILNSLSVLREDLVHSSLVKGKRPQHMTLITELSRPLLYSFCMGVKVVLSRNSG